MAAVKALIITFSMYSKIPMPHVKWEEKNMKLSIAFLPFVALPIGLVVWIWLILCYLMDINVVLSALVVTVIPIMITGGIHMDGFADTVDALSSHAPPEGKREILKDPHIGAFAVMGICVYFLIYSGICIELMSDLGLNDNPFKPFFIYDREPVISSAILPALYLFFIYFAARVTGGAAALCLQSSHNKGILAKFKSASGKSSLVTLTVMSICAFTAAFILNRIFAVSVIITCAICFIFIRSLSKKQFGGMSGDLAGYIIQINELLLIIVFVILQKVMMI